MPRGLLLVERYNVLDRPIQLGLHLNGRSYRGFDGIAWPGNSLAEFSLRNGLASEDQLPKLLAYYDKIGPPDLDLVYCSSEMDDLPGFEFVGYDLGYYESEFNHFSVLLNEVVFGSLLQLTKFRASLNECLLLMSDDDTDEIRYERERLLETDSDLEIGEERIETIPMFAIKR